jgi:hypothetical protein
MTAPRAKVTIPEVLDRFVAYYRGPRGGAWGSLHIVLDDHNIEDHSVQFCIDNAGDDEEGAALGEILLKMSKTQRGKIPDLVRAIVYPPRPNVGPVLFRITSIDTDGHVTVVPIREES